jgi:ABC-2 type transport system permease protein
MNKIPAILQKEWLEMRLDRGLLLSTLLPPLLLTFMPIAIVYGVGQTPDEDILKMGAVISNPAFAGMSPAEIGQALMGQQVSLLFLLMPLIVPSIIASYSIVGEKTRRTLEPILATPISTWELLLGKSLAAFIPAVGLTLVCGGIFLAALQAIALSPRVASAIVTPGWLIVFLLCSPLLAIISIALMVAISSRVNDPRTAQQLAAVGIIPVMGLFFGQLTGLLILSPAVALGGAAVLAVLAALTIWLATRVFQREVILTRWR